jgi:hypothetical protein
MARRGAIKPEIDVLARLEPGGLDCLKAEIQRRFRRGQIGSKATFVTHIGVVHGLLE